MLSTPSHGDTGDVSVGKLRKRYTSALSLIAILIISSQIVIQFLLADQTHDSHIVNIAGRQRMLSQKITKLSYYISSAESKDVALIYSNELEDAVILWEKSHLGLLHGDTKLDLPGQNSAEVVDLFAAIEPNFDAMLGAAKAISFASNVSDISRYVSYISEHESDFLKGMDNIVFQYEFEANSKVAFAKSLEIALMIVTLLVLLLEAIYIFAPAVRSIQRHIQTLIEREQDMKNLFSASPNAILLIDPNSLEVIRANEKAQSLLGADINEISAVTLITYLDRNYEANALFIDKLKHGKSFNEHEVVLLDSEYSAFEALISVRSTIFSGCTFLVIGITNISELKKAQLKLEYYASYDEMTSLLNRRTGMVLLSKSMNLLQRKGGQLCVCFIDLDGLKATNDQFGHAEGDWLICTVSRMLNNVVRSSDAAIRLGGDEFLLILHNCSVEDATLILAKVQFRLKELEAKECKPFKIGFSFGITTYTADRDITADELISESDDLMYQAKQKKKAKVMTA